MLNRSFFINGFTMEERFYYGGQAVIEGVMIRGQKAVVTVVRRPGGSLAVATQPLSTMYTGWMRKAPLIRGIIILIEAMTIGIKALLYSANVSLEEEEEKVSGLLLWSMVIVALAIAVALFFMAPLFLTKLLDPYIGSSPLFHLIEGCIRLVIFVTYLKLVTLVPDLRRAFAYHGAEHKTINAHEDGALLEVEAVRKYQRAHVRCSTSFLFVVMIIAIIVFALVGLPSVWLMVLARIVLIPVIAAIGYEIIYFATRHKNRLVRAILAPGLWLQSLTTREPDDSQLEVALSALNRVLEIDQMEEAA